MEKQRYKDLVKKHTPKENMIYNGLLAFVIGGLVGVFGEWLVRIYSYCLDIPTKEAGTYMLVTLIFIGCLLTSLGFFDKWVGFAKAGLFVPITGFAHSVMSAAIEYKRDGLITGLGANMLKLAGCVIIFGIVSAYTFGLIRLLLFGG